MPDIIDRAVRTTPKVRSMILIIGKTGAGKTTFINARTSEDYLRRYQTDSSTSHYSETYTIDAPGNIKRHCFYQEEPSFLENARQSTRIFLDFAELILGENGEHIAGIVYVLNHHQESRDRRVQNGGPRGPTFKEHLECARAWIGNHGPGSTILTMNRVAGDAQAAAVSADIGHVWGSVLGQQSLGVQGDDPQLVVQSLVRRGNAAHVLQLRNEVFREKKQLRKTEIGQLYIRQLKRWIDEAKDERKAERRASRDVTAVDRRIEALKADLKWWKNLEYPNVKSRRRSTRRRDSLAP